jgi:hypothetical protein
LERQLSGSGRGGIEEIASVAPAERPKISETLYNRVLGSRSRITNSGGPSFVPSERKPTNERESDRFVNACTEYVKAFYLKY